VLNEGAVAYYLANGVLVYRLVDISFFAVSPGGQLQFQPMGPLEPESPVVLEDPAATNHGRRVVWWVSEQFSTGFNISDGEPEPTEIAEALREPMRVMTDEEHRGVHPRLPCNLGLPGGL
jgi:hypothetical protein